MPDLRQSDRERLDELEHKLKEQLILLRVTAVVVLGNLAGHVLEQLHPLN